MAKQKLYIIDGHAHIYSAYYAPMRPLTAPDGSPTKSVYIFTTALLGLIERQKPDMLVVAMDSKGPSFRTKIYPEYKAHRQPMPEDMPSQIDHIEKILDAMNIPVLRLDGYEADDIIGTLSKKASAKDIDAYICSKDKDFLQLLGDHVFMYDIKKDVLTTADTMKDDIGLTPDTFIDALALQGDKADNIPGVPDVGPKTAIDWIIKYGGMDALYAHADEIKGKRGDSLRNARELAYLSRELVTINTNSPVDLDEEAFAVTVPDNDKLAAIFRELGFSKLLSQLGVKSETADGTGQPDLFSEPAYETSKTEAKNYQLIDTPEKFDKFYADLNKRKLFAIDTETTSINAMAADLVGLSFCFEPNTAYYLPVKAPLGRTVLDISTVRQKLAPIFADEKIKKVGQNIKYDMLVLSNAKMPLNGVYFDTMVASYCLFADRRSHSMDNMARDFLNYETIPISTLIGKGKNQLTFDMVDTVAACEYAAEDADVTFRLYEYLKPKLEESPDIEKLFEQVEMPLVSVLFRMEHNGVSLDVKLLRGMSVTLSDALEEITEKIFEQSGRVFNIDSTKQLAEVLFDDLGLESIKSGKTSRSTDSSVLEQLSDRHDIIPLIQQYRQIVKLKNTYVDKLGELINLRTNRVHASFNQTITATGRLSSSDPNLQNIPIRTELGRRIRAAFVPEQESDCILAADYSQIELRLLAHFSKDEALRQAFADDRDIHSFVASQIYDVSLDDVTSEMRSNCKAVNFGIIYGQGAFGLSRTIGISVQQAKKFIEDYFARYSSIKQFMDDVVAQSKKAGYAETILGRRRNINGLDSKNFNVRSQAQRLAVNTVIQGSAADLIKVAMINIQNRIDSDGMPIRMILQIHDELVFEVPKADADKYTEFVAYEMSNAIPLDVPLKVDVDTGPSWLTEK